MKQSSFVVFCGNEIYWIKCFVPIRFREAEINHLIIVDTINSFSNFDQRMKIETCLLICECRIFNSLLLGFRWPCIDNSQPI